MPRRDPRWLDARGRRSAVVAGTAACAAPRRGRGTGAGQGPALRVPHRRDRLRSGADHRPLLRDPHRQHLRFAATSTTTSPARSGCCPTPPGDAGDLRGRQDLHLQDQAGHLLRRRPGLQGRQARADRRRLRLLHQAPLRSALEEPAPLSHRGHRRHGRSCARALRARSRFDYDTPVEGLRVLDRYTLPDQARRAQPPLRLRPDDPAHRRRGRTRGGRGLWRQDHRASGRHRAVRLADWRRSSRIVFDKNPNYRDEFYDDHPPADDPLAQAAVARLEGPQAADDRPRRDQHHRGDAAALAVLPERRGGPDRAGARGLRQRRHPERQARAQSREAGHLRWCATRART